MDTPQSANSRHQRGFDALGALVKLLVTASWFTALAIVWTLSEAAPETVWGMDDFYGVTRNLQWKPELVAQAQSLTLALMMVSLAGLGVQTTQGSNRRGSFNRSLVGFAVVSIAGLVVFTLMA